MRYWCRGGVLKEVFPTLFSLSRKKQSSISSFVSTGLYPHNWNLDLRRNLIVGEIDEVIRLLDILDGVRLVPSRLEFMDGVRSGIYGWSTTGEYLMIIKV